MNWIKLLLNRNRIKNRKPNYNDYIKITDISLYKHFIGVEGKVVNMKNKLLTLENGIHISIISLENCKIEYELKNKKYKF